MTNSRTLRVLQAAAGMIVLAAGWQILSYVFPHYLFPPVPEIISRTIEILITGSLLVDVSPRRSAVSVIQPSSFLLLLPGSGPARAPPRGERSSLMGRTAITSSIGSARPTPPPGAAGGARPSGA